MHLYWCMKICGGNPDVLRAVIMNISKHYQVCVCVCVCVCALVCVCSCVCVVVCVLSCVCECLYMCV